MFLENRTPPFTVRRLGPHLLETVVDADGEIGVEEVRILHGIYQDASEERPYAVLMDQRNRCSHAPGSQTALFHQPHMIAVAFLAPDEAQERAIQALVTAGMRTHRCPWKVFREREAALRWLAMLGAKEEHRRPDALPQAR